VAEIPDFLDERGGIHGTVRPKKAVQASARFVKVAVTGGSPEKGGILEPRTCFFSPVLSDIFDIFDARYLETVFIKSLFFIVFFQFPRDLSFINCKISGHLSFID
jgi:hypothetical protein